MCLATGASHRAGAWAGAGTARGVCGPFPLLLEKLRNRNTSSLSSPLKPFLSSMSPLISGAVLLICTPVSKEAIPGLVAVKRSVFLSYTKSLKYCK